MGGKTATTQQQVQIPPEVMARYNAVNTRAETTAQQPFQQYSTSPEAFVAQLNPQQQAGMQNINQFAGAAQPAYAAGMMGTAQVAQGYTPQGYQTGVAGYMNPFLSQAMGATAAQLENINQQQQNQLAGQAISAGAFGGDRAGIARANLINQQNLAAGQTLAQMASQGYQSAAQNYLAGLGQQGAAYNQLANLGLGAQQAGIAGAQAQIGAGTLGQQTQQAGLSALYNQFLQQQAYPFQTAQFLANIAEGTGALSGSTTTTTQPMPFFSDRRLKEDIRKIGETNKGLPIYKFKYKGDPEEQTHIGFMADEVEKVHPEAVGESHGYKTVDYDRATRAEGGAVGPQHAGLGFMFGGREHHALGSAVGQDQASGIQPEMLAALVAAHQQMYGPNADAGLYGSSPASGIYGGKKGYVAEGNLPVGKLMTASQAPGIQPQVSLPQMAQDVSAIKTLYGAGKQLKEGISPSQPDLSKYPKADEGTPLPPTKPDDFESADLEEAIPEYRGGIVGYHEGGMPYENSDSEDKTKLDIPTEGDKHQLAVAGTPPGQGGSGLGDLATLAKFAMAFMKDGGRIGYADLPGGTGAVTANNQAQTDQTQTEQPSIPDIISAAAQSQNIDPALALKIAKTESSLDATAKNPKSSAGGLFQIVDDTFNKYAKGQDKFDPKTNATVGAQLIHDNQEALKAAGIEPNYANTYLAHFLGADRAKSVLANPDQPVDNYLPNSYFEANPGLKGKTGSDLINWANSRLAGKNVDFSSTSSPGAGKGIESDQGDIMSKLGSEQYLLPILAGLGTMASSNSPFLGAAILQGIGGGAQAYANLRAQMIGQQQRERQLGISQQEADIAKSRLGLTQQQIDVTKFAKISDLANTWRQYNLSAQLSGQKPISFNEYLQSMGAGYLIPDATRIMPPTGLGGAPAGTQQPPPAGGGIAGAPAGGAASAPATPQGGIATYPAMPSFDVRAGAQPQGGITATQPQGDQAAQAAVETAKAPAAAPQTPTDASVQTHLPDQNDPFWKDVDAADNIHDLERKRNIALASQLPNAAQLAANFETQRNTVLQRGYVIKNGSAVPIPGVSKVQADIASEKAKAEAEAKVGPAIDEAAKRAKIEVQKAVDEATQKSPIEVQKAIEEAKQKIPLEVQKDMMTKNVQKQMDARDAVFKEATDANQTVQQSQAMLDRMFDPETGKPVISGGPLGPQLATGAALFKQFGFSDKFVKDFFGTDPNNVQDLEKLRTSMGSELARQDLPGSQIRVAEFQRFLANTPSAEMLPAAFKWIIQNVIQPKAKAQMGVYEKISDMDPSKDNIQKAIYEYARDNPWYRAAVKQPGTTEGQPGGTTTPPAGPSQAEIAAAAKAELERRKNAGTP